MSDTIRDAKVDQESVRDKDMRGRRVVNAADSKNKQDYITRNELNKATNKKVFIELIASFLSAVTLWIIKQISPLVDSTSAILITKSDKRTVLYTIDSVTPAFILSYPVIAPVADSATALVVAKADKTTSLVTIDSTNSLLIAPLEFRFGTSTNRLRVSYNTTTKVATINAYDGIGFQQVSLDAGAAGLFLNVNSGGPLTVGGGASTIGFFGAAAAAKQTLAAYVTNSKSVAFTGIATGVAGTPYAQLTDLNNLRVAYENIRAMVDDMRTKVQTSTLVG